MGTDLDALVGRAIQVVLLTTNPYISRQVEFGRLQAYDGGWLYLQRFSGEAVSLVRDQVTDIAEIESTPDVAEPMLLRPASEPDDALLRPAGSADVEDRALLRPARDDDE